MPKPSRRLVVPAALGGLVVGLFVVRTPIPWSGFRPSTQRAPGAGSVGGLTFGVDGRSAVGGNGTGADEQAAGVRQSTDATADVAAADGWPRVVEDRRPGRSAARKADLLARRGIVPAAGDTEDTAAPEGVAGPAALSLGLGIDFSGFAQSTVRHPNPVIAAGPRDLVAAVQDQVRFYDARGNVMVSRSIADWFRPALPTDASGIELSWPDVAYDRPDGRFVMMTMAKRERDRFSRYLLAVSDDALAQGEWCMYSLDATIVGGDRHPEWKANWGRVATTQNAVVITANLGEIATDTGVYAVARTLAKSALYRPPGQCALPPTWRDLYDIRYGDNSPAYDLMPATSASGPLHLIAAPYDGGDTLTVFEVALNADNPPTVTSSRRLFYPTSRWDVPPDAPQLGSRVPLDTGYSELQQANRQGDFLWTSHTIACSWLSQGDGVTRSCLRWYQLDLARNVVAQMGTFGRAGGSYFFPALVADAQQNAFVTFNASGPDAFPSARYTGRLATDTARELRQSQPLRGGTGCYENPDPPEGNAFGRRAGIALDPSGIGAWLHAESVTGTDANCGRNRWQTHIGLAQWVAPTATATSTPRPSATPRPTRAPTATRTPRPGVRTATPKWRKVELPVAVKGASVGRR